MSFRFFFAAGVLAFSALSGASPAQAPSQTAAVQAHAAYTLGTFVGNMPCADCPGITVTLTLYTNGPNDFTNATYSEQLLYQGKNVKPFITNGKWTVTKGMPGNPQATLYELNPDMSGKEQYFLQVGADALRQLDPSKQEIHSPYNITLKRVAKPK
jgi:uncharacterized lipoprotein NlpE involved in copper resistance